MKTMKIRMLVSTAGVDFALSPGDETERFSTAEALRMIEAGQAVPVAATRVETPERKSLAVETRTGRNRLRGAVDAVRARLPKSPRA